MLAFLTSTIAALNRIVTEPSKSISEILAVTCVLLGFFAVVVVMLEAEVRFCGRF